MGEPFGLKFEFRQAEPGEEVVAPPGEDDQSEAQIIEWEPTHRVVTSDSVYLVMIRESDGNRFAWTHGEHNSAKVAPFLKQIHGGPWLFKGEPFTGNVHSLAPAAPDRHTHRR